MSATTTDGVAEAYGRLAEIDFFGDFYDHSDYLNFGYRVDGEKTQREACDALVDALLACIPFKTGRILDVACGKGATTRRLLEHYAPSRVTAINITAEHLERARDNAPGVRLREMDATDLDFPDASFDALICVEAAFHFRTRGRFLLEAVRVLKPGGRLVLSDMLLPAWSPIQPPENYVEDPSEYERQCLGAGFEDAWVADAREECWGGIRDALERDTLERARDGDLPWRDAQAILGWLRRGEAAIRHYVLGCCLKAR